MANKEKGHIGGCFRRQGGMSRVVDDITCKTGPGSAGMLIRSATDFHQEQFQWLLNIPSLVPGLYTSFSHSLARLSAVPVVFGFPSCLGLQNASRGFRARRPGPAGTAPGPEAGGVGGPTGHKQPLSKDPCQRVRASSAPTIHRTLNGPQAADKLATSPSKTNSFKQSQLSVPDAAVLHHRTYLMNTTQALPEPPRKLAG